MRFSSKASLETVLEFLVEPALMAQWLGSSHTLELLEKGSTSEKTRAAVAADLKRIGAGRFRRKISPS